ncbi:MAG: Lipid-A-disaccharide synthase [Verrucomicrobiales bacterium]|nr:Lipid-A-disaccharide synthase [Verrucomicrobiales bacterium]
MKALRVMVIAGDPSGDALAADLVRALGRGVAPLPCSFFGAGGPKMAEAGVELAFDLTSDSVIGISDVLKKLPQFRKRFSHLVNLAVQQQPDLFVLVDFSGFNRRFAKAIRERQAQNGDWKPRIVQYVSPQVWASRSGRARSLVRDVDLLLCLFPFEKVWYVQRFPKLKVEFVGPPIFDRYANYKFEPEKYPVPAWAAADRKLPLVVMLPGSRKGELKRHLPVMLEALARIEKEVPVRYRIVLPETLDITGLCPQLPRNLIIQHGGLAEALQEATIAISKTGTVMLECAYFNVPTVAIYKTSWLTALIARYIIQVKFLAMPNLLANEAVFPELLQQDATAEKIAIEALDLLRNSPRRSQVQSKLKDIISQLGGVGGTERAAAAILKLMGS